MLPSRRLPISSFDCDEPCMKRAKKKMPLHRDIYWVGKQWSVTGQGMQAIDQKLKGKFDIDVSRLWEDEDDLLEELREEKWFNAKDFDKALAEARKRYPEPPRKAAPKARKAAPVLAVAASSAETAGVKDQPTESPEPAPVNFAMHIEGSRAKLLPMWRVRVRWQG
jgi:hypothetical protein